jgi:hypothetical protein
VKGLWTRSEAATSINTRELWAAERVIKAITKWRKLRGKTIRYLTDSIVAYYYLNKMTGKVDHLAEIAGRILLHLEERGMNVIVEHISSKENHVADKLSRFPMNRSDWRLNPRVFALIKKKWGPFSVDWFADRNNTQLPRFCAWGLDEEATYVDALQNLWRKEKGYGNPPFSLIGQTLKRLEEAGKDMVIIVPMWPAQTWCHRILIFLKNLVNVNFVLPQLLDMLTDLPLVLPATKDLFLPPRNVKYKEDINPPPWRTLACRVSGKLSKVKDFRGRLWKWLSPPSQIGQDVIIPIVGIAGQLSQRAKTLISSILHYLSTSIL